MRYRIFLYMFFTYFLTLGILAFVCDYLMRWESRDNVRILRQGSEKQIRTIVEQELARLTERFEDLSRVSGRFDASAEDLVSKYQLGRDGYAWLLDKSGNILSYPRWKRVLDPEILKADQREIVPLVRKDPTRGEKELEDQSGKRLVIYNAVPGTDRVLCLVFPLQRETTLEISLGSTLWMIFFVLSLGGFLACIYFSGKIWMPFLSLANFVHQVSLEREITAPGLGDDPEMKMILAGMDRIRKVLRERTIRELNALTNLPGNAELQHEIFQRIDSGKRFAVGFVDINDFSSYNHKYGFTKGDGVIRFLALVVTSKIREYGTNDDFVAHLGGDHLVFITEPEKVDKICSETVRSFDDHIPLYYDEEDRSRGYILSKNRKGEIQKFSFMTVSIGVATNEQRPLIHPLQINQVTGEIRNYLKTWGKSGYLRDRRKDDREEARSPESGKEVSGDAAELENP